ncbi:MAG: cytosine permease [Gammaproteobacteria bacterium]|nr:cytosine permease [Gammaproteobacteria bacterium]
MSSSDSNDFSQQPVPSDQTKSSSHIALIIIGGTIAIPAFLMAAQLSNKLGFFDAIFAFFAGAIILGGLIFCTSWVGGHSRLSTSKLAEQAFGVNGAKLSNAVMALTLAGWYGINCKMFGQATAKVMHSFGIDLSVNIYMVIGSLLMLWVSLKGFKGIDKLALYLVPLMIGFIIYATSISIASPQVELLWQSHNELTLLQAISAVVGAYIVGAVIQPDYSRFATNAKRGSVAATLALGLTFPLVLILVSIPAVIAGQTDLILIMMNIGIGVPAFLLLLLSSWSSNVLSLYSASLSLNTIAPKISLTQFNFAVAFVGTVIAFGDVQEYFIDFLIVLGICIPPIGAIYCLHWLFEREKNVASTVNWRAMIAWFSGCTMGFLSYFDRFSMSGIATLDTIICSALAFFVLKFSRQWYAQSRVGVNNE